MLTIEGELTHFPNPAAAREKEYSSALREIISVAKAKQVIADIKSWPAYSPTPIHKLNHLGKNSGLAAIW